MKKVFIIAGEVSGDVLGGEIMRAAAGRVEFVGVGGDCMKSAGLKTIFPISDLSVMGVVEVLMKSRTLMRRINETAAAIIREKPDAVLTIDAPSFAIRVIKKVRAKSANVPKFYHVVAPMVWAWGAGRAKKYARVFDTLFCFFDFEKPYFEKYGLKTIAIGHPIYDVMKNAAKEADADAGGKRYTALLPGSRMSEAARIMPIFKRVSERLPNRNFAIPVTETTKDFITKEVAAWSRPPEIFPFKDRVKLYAMSDAAVAKSGTGTAELAIMNVPTVVVYRTNWITALVFRLVVKVRFASLVNILRGRGIFPELLGRHANADEIIAELEKMNREKTIAELRAADHLWHKSEPPMKIVVANVCEVPFAGEGVAPKATG